MYVNVYMNIYTIKREGKNVCCIYSYRWKMCLFETVQKYHVFLSNIQKVFQQFKSC